MKKYFFVFILFGLIHASLLQTPCSPKQTTAGIVCVCNSTYCDDFPQLPNLASNQVGIFRSSLSGQRFFFEQTMFGTGQGQSDIAVTINASQTYQKIHGFGGAFTGTASFNIMSLPSPSNVNLIKSYFGSNGIGYTTCRVTIAASDFSLKGYSYDDVEPSSPDFNLTNFKLDPQEDLMYKIPAMQLAQSISPTNIKLFGSPWSPPAWMKNNSNIAGTPFASIIGSPDPNAGNTDYYNTYANYFYRFFEEHSKHNISFWGLTIQNEPYNQMTPGMYLVPEKERDFIKNFLGPKIRGNALTKDLKIMIWDFNRGNAENYTDTILADQLAASYVDGIAIHWYDDVQFGINYTVPEIIHAKHSDKWIMNTEACAGWMGPPADVKGVTLGNWTRGELYAHDILDNLNHWSTGWVDWNMVLNETGGPLWQANPVDAPIIVNSTYNGEFYKQPMYYVLGHFSKFIVPDSLRIDLQWNTNPGVEGVAFATPENKHVLVLFNTNDMNYTVSVKDLDNPTNTITTNLEAKSIATFIWNKQNDVCSCPSSGQWYQSTVNPCNCYSFIQNQKSWSEANLDCQQQNSMATLATIDSAFENNEILGNSQNLTGCAQFFIGLQESPSNEWQWINNDTSTYRNWRAGYPTNTDDNRCSQLNVNDGKWTNVYCENYGCYVCEIKNI